MAEAGLTAPRPAAREPKTPRAERDPARSPARARAALYMLPVATTLAMAGIVVAANPGRYGPVGAAVGALVAVAAIAGAVRGFRRAGGSASDRNDEHPEGET